MSGMEMIALLASAGQVAEYGLYFLAFISATYHRIKDAPAEIEEYISQIEEFLKVTDFVQRGPYDPAIYPHIQSIRSTAEQVATIRSRISNQYKKKSLWLYWLVITRREHKKILAIYEKLEKAELSLIKCMLSRNSGSLSSIRLSLKKLEVAISSPVPPTMDSRYSSTLDQTHSRREANRSPGSYSRQGHSTASTIESGQLVQHHAQQQNLSGEQSYRQSDYYSQNAESQRDYSQPSGAIHKMRKIAVTEKSSIFNGHRFVGYKQPLGQITTDGTHEMDDITVDGGSRANNGNEYVSKD